MEQHPLTGLAQLSFKGIVAFELFFLVMVYVLPSFISGRPMLVAVFGGVLALIAAASGLVAVVVDEHSVRWVRPLGAALGLLGAQLGIMVAQSFARVDGFLGPALSIVVVGVIVVALWQAARSWAHWNR
ncbi:MAG: hypothetical protein AAF567_10885 [Actinomycetota bacterium]